jgi:hypothetical protein
MVIKIRQGLTPQHSLKLTGLVSSFLQWNEVLNLTEGHHSFDQLFWATMLDNIKVLEIFGG